jgi:hypothetical protein
MASAVRRVFISATSDLRAWPQDRSFVQAAADAVSRAGDVVLDLTLYPSSAAPPAEVSREAVLGADVVVSLLGFRYGLHVVGQPSVSYPEFELDVAAKAGIPQLVFLLDESVPLPASMILGGEVAEFERQLKFRRRLRNSGLVVQTFSSPDQLQSTLLQALVNQRQSADQVRSRGTRRSVLILGSGGTRDLGMLLARELAPDAAVLVWPNELGRSLRPGGVDELLSRLAKVDLGVILPLDPLADVGSAQEWFEIGTVVGALGAARTFLVAPNGGAGLAGRTGLPILRLSAESEDPEAVRAAASVLRHQLAVLEPRSDDEPAHYSCFLSYSRSDEEFVSQLYKDLQDAGIPSWFAPQEIPGGSRWDQQLHRALAGQDKVLFVLSGSSVDNPLMQMELRAAEELERERGREVLFPLLVDDTALTSNSPWATELLEERQFSDFRGWQDEALYRRALRRLILDLTLRADSSVAGSGR